MRLGKYSMGIGDRFGRQGEALLRAVITAKQQGADVVPVWNKSHREHIIIGTSPADVRREADAAVQSLGWRGAYHVDADHIGMGNVGPFIASSDFFTLDVAAFIGGASQYDEIRSFIDKHRKYVGNIAIPGIDGAFRLSEKELALIAQKFAPAVKEAAGIHRHIENIKGADNFVVEISMDECDAPQTPVELFFILAAVADEGIPAQTIAPKFTGRFNKGVDYVGDVSLFAREFDENLSVISFAIKEFGLRENLKLSVHSGSDKFSIYDCMRDALKRHDAGLHLKTAGTTWLEELAGLAQAGGNGLKIAKEIYAKAFERFDELRAPYASVTDIDRRLLPAKEVVAAWDGEQFAATLRHDISCESYNPHFRQLLHVSYKTAAEMGERYLNAVEEFKDVISQNVTENIHARHLARVFPSARRDCLPPAGRGRCAGHD